jgi:hypothetical protein
MIIYVTKWNNNTENRKDINHKSYIIDDKSDMVTININGRGWAGVDRNSVEFRQLSLSILFVALICMNNLWYAQPSDWIKNGNSNSLNN